MFAMIRTQSYPCEQKLQFRKNSSNVETFTYCIVKHQIVLFYTKYLPISILTVCEFFKIKFCVQLNRYNLHSHLSIDTFVRTRRLRHIQSFDNVHKKLPVNATPPVTTPVTLTASAIFGFRTQALTILS